MPEQAPAVDSPAVGRLIRFLVCGLPLGLFIMGALSFVIYFQKRNAAKGARDFALADTVRNELKALGWTVEDSKTGSKLKRL
jgi:hypothetical protein